MECEVLCSSDVVVVNELRGTFLLENIVARGSGVWVVMMILKLETGCETGDNS